MEWRDGEPVYVSLWSGEPEASPGSAVVVSHRGAEGIATVSVCECGDQGCADASFQLRGRFRVDDIPDLVEMLDGLHATTAMLSDSNIWRPDDWKVSPRSDWPDQSTESTL